MATRTMNKNPRISFGQSDSAHLYELAFEHFCTHKNEGICPMCVDIKERLEEYIGQKETKSIQRLVRRHSYCKEL